MVKYLIKDFINWLKKHKRLIKRRGGIKAHYKLSKKYRQIDSDYYVIKAREYYRRKSGYPYNRS